MTPTLQRIAIAKALGWKLRYQNVGGGTLFEEKPKGHSWEVWLPPPVKLDWKEEWQQPPDFLSDLNAMHEALTLLSDKQETHVDESGEYSSSQRQRYLDHLEELIKPTTYEENIEFALTTASAAHCAEAFLRTLSLWEDSVPS